MTETSSLHAYVETKVLLPDQRRYALLQEMQVGEAKGIDCSRCAGTCCTFVANSMRVTPLETYDLWLFLKRSNRWNSATRQQLLHTVDRFRLSQPIPGNGRRRYGRRTYTCSFFNNQVKGCSIAPEYKPYGCLGFNPNIPAQLNGGDCGLQRRFSSQTPTALEQNANAQIKSILKFDEETKTIPEGLLAAWGKDSDLEKLNFESISSEKRTASTPS